MTGRNEIIIRDAVSQDIDSIMEIERESFLPGVREDRDLYLKRISVFPQGFLVAQNALTREIGGYIVSEIWCEDLSFFPEKPRSVHAFLRFSTRAEVSSAAATAIAEVFLTGSATPR